MKASLQIQNRPIPGSVMPARISVVQRKCACGGKIDSAAGECPECRRRRLLGERPPLVQTKLRINAPGDQFEQEADRVADQISHGSDHQGHCFAAMNVRASELERSATLSETAFPEEPVTGKEPYEEGGEIVELATGGSSKCNLAGDAQTITNNNDECTRPCTQEHEENHVARRAPCCEQARAAYHSARDAGDTARRNRVTRLWNDWVNANNAASECEAYQVSINCANRMYSDQACASSESECCDQIVSYRTHVTERKNHYCGLSGDSTDRTPCPDFS